MTKKPYLLISFDTKSNIFKDLCLISRDSDFNDLTKRNLIYLKDIYPKYKQQYPKIFYSNNVSTFPNSSFDYSQFKSKYLVLRLNKDKAIALIINIILVSEFAKSQTLNDDPIISLWDEIITNTLLPQVELYLEKLEEYNDTNRE